MGIARARAELKDGGGSSEERWSAFKRLLGNFKKACSDAGVQHDYRQHEYYESPSVKKRRKMREAESQKVKAKIKENFPEKKRD